MNNKQLRRLGIKYQNNQSPKKIPLVEAMRIALAAKMKEEADAKRKGGL